MLSTTLSTDERITTAHRAKLAYVYVTTQNFRSIGYVSVDRDGTCHFADQTVGVIGITQVRSTIAKTPAGFQLTSEYYRDGKWTPGHGFTYHEAPPGYELQINPAPVIASAN